MKLLCFFQLLFEVAREIGRLAGAEITQIVEWTDLDVAILALVRSGGALGPFDGFLSGLDLNDPESGDEFFALGEGAVDHGALVPREMDPGAFGAWLEAC